MSIKIVEHKSSSYAPRTYANASSSDVTIALAVDYNTAGERLTHKAAGDKYLKLDFLAYDDITLARMLYKRFAAIGGELPTLNVAGNGIYTLSKSGITQGRINQRLYNIIAKVNEYWPIGKIISGGQTGVDLAGGVVGVALGIDVIMTLPNGFVQRHEDMKDIKHTEQEVLDQVTFGVSMLNM